MRKIVSPAIFILGFILLSALNSHAAPPTDLFFVGGEYFLIGSRSCAQVNNFEEFGDNWSLPSPFGGTTRTAHLQGILNLNGDGSGTLTFFATQYIHQAVNGGATPLSRFRTPPQTACDVTYGVRPNGILEFTQLPGCLTLTTEGAGSGRYFTSGGEVLIFGTSTDGGVLLLSDTRPVKEVVWETDPEGNQIDREIYRECSRTYMAVRTSFRR